MIHTAIISVIASFDWTADLVSSHPAMDLNSLASPSRPIPDDRLRDFATRPVKGLVRSQTRCRALT
jgi:hypothetical protein